MKNKRKNQIGIIVAILLLAVGFAAVTTTLYINGTARIVPDTEGFASEVIFATADVDNESASAEIADAGKSITFTTQDLKNIDDQVVLTYSIKNDSDYNASLGELTCTSEDPDYATYLTVTPANGLSGTTLNKGATSDTDTVTVKMIRSYVGGEKEISFNCTIDATAQEA